MTDISPDIERLLEPFRGQSAPIKSIVAVGCPPMEALPSQLDPAGDDLLISPAQTLQEQMPPIENDYEFRAVAALFPRTTGPLTGEDAWRLRRSLFDRGMVCIGSVRVAEGKALCFLASDAIRSLSNLDIEPRGHVAISVLRDGAGFANRLFRYACVKLYAIRHGLTPSVPGWEGNQLFGLDDEFAPGLVLKTLSFPGFAENDRTFWTPDIPPIDIDLDGYFQEIPECWRRQRPLLRRLFQLADQHVAEIDRWRDSVTENGQRTLVAIHIRRGDYRRIRVPFFQMVPEEWYLRLLRTIWPTLHRPILFVATDEPEAIRPAFKEFEMVSATFGQALPEHMRDFEVMRRADYFAICNSSFSHMASILAPSSQKCFIPSFRAQAFEPYEPWIDPAFWARFRDPWNAMPIVPEAPVQIEEDTSNEPVEQAPIYFDATDLVRYLLHHTTLSGIQRVQCEVLTFLLGHADSQPIRVVVLNEMGGLDTIHGSTLLGVIEDFRSDSMSKAAVRREVDSLLAAAIPCTIRPREVFLTIGAFWGVAGMGRLLQRLKSSGAIIGVFIHDIIPIVAPEYFIVREVRIFVKAVSEALNFADFILTTSEYNRTTLIGHMASKKLDPLPVHVVPLAHAFSPSTPAKTSVSSVIAGILATDYVLCVGTIEVRKNPTYLFQIWNLMVRSGRANTPHLVFAGRKGWFTQDLMDQLNACNYLGGRVVVVRDATDVELGMLYQTCILTMFPSFVEGWGLPVGESLAHGKICLCSALGGIPEVGGDLADYLDPFNVRDGLNLLTRYLDDPELRRSRELAIADRFVPRTWKTAANDFLRSTEGLARLVGPFTGVAAMTFPANEFLPIGTGPQMDGTQSGELACVSGWAEPETGGVRALQPDAMIRFRADAEAGTKISLLLRLATRGRDFRIRIRSGSGAQTEVSVAAESEKLAALSCTVEPEKLVTAILSAVEDSPDAENLPYAHWALKGFLYFDPKRAMASALKSPAANPPVAKAPIVPVVSGPAISPRPGKVLLRPMEGTRQAASFGAFLQTENCFWPVESTTNRIAPDFGDHPDRRTFDLGCGNPDQIPQLGRIKDSIRLMRRSDQFVSMARFSEGSVFDRGHVWRAFGYLEGGPPEHTPWLSKNPEGLWADEESLGSAPYFEGTHAIFYNGNLHNYYHWVVEGLLCLDILSQALGAGSNLKILLPKSVDIAALIHHRESLQALGFSGPNLTEVASPIVRVEEAIWVDSDLVQRMPAPYLKDFNHRIAALYAPVRAPKKRRLLVARKGPTRKIRNLEQVQAILSKQGFDTVYLEGMSTRDQILLFQSAEYIITPHGAGMSNLLFCEAGTKVIELSPSTEFRPFFWIISEKLDLIHGLLFCQTIEDHGYQGFQGSIIVDVNKLQDLMRVSGKG